MIETLSERSMVTTPVRLHFRHFITTKGTEETPAIKQRKGLTVFFDLLLFKIVINYICAK
jgi:hypothetical protein